MILMSLLFTVNAADKLGVVVYDTNVKVIEGGLTAMNDSGKSMMLDSIETLAAGSSTNLSGGLSRGLEMLEATRVSGLRENVVASVLLMTDGQANVGYVSADDIIRCLTIDGRLSLPPPARGSAKQRQRPSGKDVPKEDPPVSKLTPPDLASKVAGTVYTFGFGRDHNADLLQAISEAANGMYYFIDSAEKIPESFADCLGGLLSPVAQNISIELKTSDGVTIVSAFSGRDKKSSASGKACSLTLGDIQSEERRDVLLKLSVPKLDSEQASWDMLQAKLTYFNVITSCMEEKETRLSAARPGVKRDGLEGDEEVDTHKNRVMAAEAMQEAARLADRGDMMEARGVIERVSYWLLHNIGATFLFDLFVVDSLLSVTGECAS